MNKALYQERINNVLDYIENNLDSNFVLDDLSTISNFSKFHFTRIFKSMTGESPFELIQRIRLERAASMLIRSNESIGSIAFKCGFNNLSVFSKYFKILFGQSATNYRKENSNIDKVIYEEQADICTQTRSVKWQSHNFNCESTKVVQLQEMSFVYLRHIGPYAGDAELFEKLFSKLNNWATHEGLPKSRVSAIVYHDDAYVADKTKLRTSICISAPKSIDSYGEIGKLTIPKGKYVAAEFHIEPNEFQQAWDWLMGEWFPKSVYQPGDRPCFELFEHEPQGKKFRVKLCVPLKRF